MIIFNSLHLKHVRLQQREMRSATQRLYFCDSTRSQHTIYIFFFHEEKETTNFGESADAQWFAGRRGKRARKEQFVAFASREE